jgi:uncharacterized protein (TIRG00374 family)
MSKRHTRLLLLLGIALFVFIILITGPEQIWQNLKRITLVNFLILVVLRILYWLLRTISWKAILDEFEKPIPLFELFQVRMISHAVSQLTPSAQIGGETSRVMLTNCSSRKISLSSVVIDKSIELLSAVLFTLIGIGILFARFTLPVRIKIFFITAITIASILVIFLQLKQRKGLLVWVVKLLTRFRIARKTLSQNRKKIIETDQYISNFYQFHQPVFLKVFLQYGLLTLLWVTENYLTLRYIGVKTITFSDSFLITTLGSMSLIFPFIPASLGVYDITYVGLFALLRLNAAAAITLVMIRRIIALMMAGLGLLPMLSIKKRGNIPDRKKTGKS